MSLGPSFIHTTRRACPKSYLGCRRKKGLCSSVRFLPCHCERTHEIVAGSLSNMSLMQVMLFTDISCQLLRYRVKASQFTLSRRQGPLVGAGTHSGPQLCEVCICAQSIKCPCNSTSNPRLFPSHHVVSICMLNPPQDLVASLNLSVELLPHSLRG